jgi:arsenical pump membrane protein
MGENPTLAGTDDGAGWRTGLVGGRILAVVGVGAAIVALSIAGSEARSAAAQVWPPFVLVAGLLLVGLVADQDGLFAAAGRRLASLAPTGTVLFAGAAVTIAGVTAVLNLDTSVVFLTPVFVHAARSRQQDDAPLLVGSILLANAASLLLPGSNLTNLIVLGHLHLSGGQFVARMGLPWLASTALTALVIAIACRRSLHTGGGPVADKLPREKTVSGLGVVAVATVVVLVLVLRSPAVPVAAVGVLVALIRVANGRLRTTRATDVLGLPVLVGLFGVAVAMGTLGRTWSGPATLLTHLDPAGTAVTAAVASVAINNLPAASLLAARVPPHPFALLVGLDIGPNLFVTGSLAWVLWWRTVWMSRATPPVGRAVGLGLVSAPIAAASAVVLLSLAGPLKLAG